MPDPARVNVIFDAHGSWHGGRSEPRKRWNVLYGDGHGKSANRDQYEDAWSQPVYGG